MCYGTTHLEKKLLMLEGIYNEPVILPQNTSSVVNYWPVIKFYFAGEFLRANLHYGYVCQPD